jgi:hypothetical protein
MQLAGLDWAIIVGFFVFWLALGASVRRKAGQSTERFFLAGRGMPWWLLGYGGCWDLGYPRSVERPDGRIVTAHYFNDNPNTERYIAATIWSPEVLVE